MDRDVALNMVQKLTAIQTATEHISAGVTSSQSTPATLSLSREINEYTGEPEATSEEPEIISEEPKSKKTRR